MVPQRQSYRPDRTVDDLRYLENEARALLMRLRQVKPFATHMPIVDAAAVSPRARKAIAQLLIQGRAKFEQKVNRFILLLHQKPAPQAEQMQQAFAILKLQFNALLDQLDIFADAFTQRGEHEVGIWLAGLDAFARDALRPQLRVYQSPPLICYLDRGHGAAIRRARTRLPGGPANPVAVIRIPRERMVSSGIASSLVHEVGHQGIALLNLVNSIRAEIRSHPKAQMASWKLFDRWISEILADCWAVGMLGISATTGLMGVVSLPKYFVLRINVDDPHPFPWIRVLLSSTVGQMLYPAPQWQQIANRWLHFYPSEAIPKRYQKLIGELRQELPHWAQLICNHTLSQREGTRFRDIFPIAARQPKNLRHLFSLWQQSPEKVLVQAPALVFAVLGQARSDLRLSPEQEHQWLTRLLRHWAIGQALR